jgi:hypothetical protein
LQLWLNGKEAERIFLRAADAAADIPITVDEFVDYARMLNSIRDKILKVLEKMKAEGREGEFYYCIPVERFLRFLAGKTDEVTLAEILRLCAVAGVPFSQVVKNIEETTQDV